jgi:hypothetical protein
LSYSLQGCVFLATSSEVNADPSLTTGKVAKSQDVTTSVLPPIRTRTPPNASSDVMAFPGVLGFPTIARTGTIFFNDTLFFALYFGFFIVTDICQAVGQVKVFRVSYEQSLANVLTVSPCCSNNAKI